MKIIHAFGSRACAIKMAPLIKEGRLRGHTNILVWSGQHYDDNLYRDLFDDLEIPRPDYDIEAKGSSPQIGAKILVEFEKICQKEKPDIVLTHGDTFTAMFFSQSAALSLVPVGHVEAGLRTYSWEPFPEQICTKTSDACSALFFAATEKNARDLLSEHVPQDRLFTVGNSIVDASLQHAELAKKKSDATKRFKIKHPFVFWSCHRKENMLSEKRMRGIFDSLLEMTDANFFCSVLPSTQMAAEKYGYMEKIGKAKHVIWEPCLPKYTDALRLMLEANLVLTDCLHPETYVQLADGSIKMLKEIHSADILQSVDTSSLTNSFGRCAGRGEKMHKKVLRIVTTGNEVISSKQHRFYAIDGQEIVQKRAKQLKPGDYLLALRNLTIAGKKQRIESKVVSYEEYVTITKDGRALLQRKRKHLRILTCNAAAAAHISESHLKNIEIGTRNCAFGILKAVLKTYELEFDEFCRKYVKKIMRPTHRKIKIPNNTSKELCELLGALLGDGCRNDDYHITITDKDGSILRHHQKLFQKVFGCKFKIRKGNRQRIYIDSKAIVEFFDSAFPVVLIPSDKRDIPDLVARASKEELAGFIRGLYTAEGSVGDHSIQISMVSERTIRKLKMLLLRFGVISSYYKYRGKRSRDVHVNHMLEIYNPTSIRRFIGRIGFSSSEKNKRAKRLLSQIGSLSRNTDLIPIDTQFLEDARKSIGITYKEITEAGISYRFCASNKIMPRKDTFEKIVELLQQKDRNGRFVETLNEMKRMLSQDICFEKIQKIDEIENNVPFVDIFVPGRNNFIANCLLVHNSGGMQEECSALHIPCLTLRYVTDRPESVETGANKCVGCEKEIIMRETRAVLFDGKTAQKMRAAKNSYGDGKTSGRIFDIIEKFEGKLERWENKIR